MGEAGWLESWLKGGKEPESDDFHSSSDLHFCDRPQVFASDEKRILFIPSYLKGSALSRFEPGLNNPTDSALDVGLAGFPQQAGRQFWSPRPGRRC